MARRDNIWFVDLSGWSAITFILWYFYDMIVSDTLDAVKTNKQ